MCSIKADYKFHPKTCDDSESSGGSRPLPSVSTTDSLVSLGHTLKFTDICLQSFEENCTRQTMIYR